MIKLKYILAFLIISIFFGCDRFGAYEYYIENKSDSELTVSYKWLNDLESKKVPPHSSMLINSFETNNGLVDRKDLFLKRYFDTLYVLNNNSFITKDISNRDNWSYITDEEKYSNIYTFTVENKDLK